VIKKYAPIYSLAPDVIVDKTCSDLGVTASHRLLVIQKWPQHTVLIFDIFHPAYDVSTAHYKENIQVLRIIISKQFDARLPSSDFQEHINAQVAAFHNLNGWSAVPPYIEDQTDTVRKYLNPRDTSLL
jgi:hypothetical protein